MIKDDIQILIAWEDEHFKQTGKYVQALKTPEKMPSKNSVSNFTSLRKPSNVQTEIAFISICKDYQFAVHVHETIDINTKKVMKGFVVIAKRDLGDDIVEIVSGGGGALDYGE